MPSHSYAKEYRTFFYNLKRFGFSLSKEEIKQIIITVVMIGFVWSFNKWGGETFNFLEGIKNFGLGCLMALICTVFNQVGQRVVAVYYGYDPVYEYGIIGLMIALVVTFASRGYLIFFLPGAINIRHLTASRLGEFRYYTNDWEWAKAGFMGPFFNVILLLLLSPFKSNPFVMQLMVLSLLFAIYSLIPLPGNVGLYLFYPHIYFWTFTLAFVVVASAIGFFLSPIIALLAGLLFGAIAMFWHYDKVDKRIGEF
ncbi:TPA: hypothetical protein HA239_03030 [Candidatus Woesearchaeota archaeon]|nr:hypothetical protein QT06_C0001G0681 [archaeon GW2011_AR15]MBS3103532.1 hypothetical protein [Candidatus Woesearchaeota archaeon]HIH41364.1 hypothetical protein [Candidatus Woesearchaeota archaeon]